MWHVTFHSLRFATRYLCREWWWVRHGGKAYKTILVSQTADVGELSNRSYDYRNPYSTRVNIRFKSENLNKSRHTF